jgi:predicted kinase
MLFLIRGLPSSGKSTLAEKLAGGNTVEADDFFMDDGVYKFDPKLLPQAHAYCQDTTDKLLSMGLDTAVANTFTQRWEMQVYLEMAVKHGVSITVIDLFDGGLTDEELHARNKHGVPLEAFAKMRERYVHDWGQDNPLPPWER